MDQLVQIFASLVILVAFVSAQRGALSALSPRYLLLSVTGSTILTILAAHERRYGFLLLECCWALASAWGLVHILREQASPHCIQPVGRWGSKARTALPHGAGGRSRTLG